MATAFVDLIFKGDTNRLNKSLRSSQRDVKRYQNQVGREFRKIGKAAAVGVAGAAAALTGLAKASLSSADEIAKSARNAGFAAEEFQLLSHAFELSGSSADSLVKGSQTLSKQILGLRDGTKTAEDAFGRLGTIIKRFRWSGYC